MAEVWQEFISQQTIIDLHDEAIKRSYAFDTPKAKTPLKGDEMVKNLKQLRLCAKCGTKKSSGWYRLSDGRSLCDSCGDVATGAKSVNRGSQRQGK